MKVRRVGGLLGLWLGVGATVTAAMVACAFAVAGGAAASPERIGGVSTPTSAASATTRVGYFKTPSGNIVCAYGISTGSRASESYVGCRIKWRLKPEPRGTPPGCWSTGDLDLRATGRPTTGRTICPGDPEGDAGVFVYESRARVLAYGMSWSGGGLRCRSAFSGLTCRNKSGHGFFLSREHWRAF